MSLRRRIFYLLVVVGFLSIVVNIHQKVIGAQNFFDGGVIPGVKISSAEKPFASNSKKQDGTEKGFQEGNDLEEGLEKEFDFGQAGQGRGVREAIRDFQLTRSSDSSGLPIGSRPKSSPLQAIPHANGHGDAFLPDTLTRLDAPMVLSAKKNKMRLNHSIHSENQRLWFFSGGARRPKPTRINKKTGKRIAKLWPHEDWGDDRILNQLMFVPPARKKKPERLKKILFYFGLGSWNLKPGRDVFIESKCPVDTCTVTASHSEAPDVDAILFKDRFVHPGHVRHPRQVGKEVSPYPKLGGYLTWSSTISTVWILYFLECPYHTQHIKFNDVINWTATYRRDSDIVAPYERWVYYNPRVKQKLAPDKNYAANKTKSVAWFVSNCAARNNRLQYANELKKYIPVDIYGACGTKKCPRFPVDSKEMCFHMLDKDYKFYLAFENSNCRDYITEKLFVNGLGRDILPIVMGAHPEDYAKSTPEHSYIHVDDFASPKELAAYLHKLDKDDDLYNSYFRWKGTGEFINTYFMCRLCALLHDDYPAKSYRDINEWWRGSGICTQHSWRGN